MPLTFLARVGHCDCFVQAWATFVQACLICRSRRPLRHIIAAFAGSVGLSVPPLREGGPSVWEDVAAVENGSMHLCA